MKEVGILIPNLNCYEMIELCVESVRRFTEYPNYRIIVCDDNSQNGVDLEYLRGCQARGWLTLYEHDRRHGHGGMLNRLVNDICDTELAFLMDSDIQILGSGWLEAFVGAASENSDIIAVGDTMFRYFTPHCYRVPVYHAWFGLLNMNLYRDGMEVDWKSKKADRREEPFKTIFAPYYPPKEPGLNWERWNENFVAIDPGGNFWIKFNYDNPKGYKVVPMPKSLKNKYHHYDHVSFLSSETPEELSELTNAPNQIGTIEEVRQKAKRRVKFTMIKDQLARLRCQT